MPSQNVQHDHIEHIVRTTTQWTEAGIANYAIPRGVLCVELLNNGTTKLKVGEGDKFYRQLPYVGGEGGGDLSNYYTKEQVDRIIQNLKAVTIPSTQIYPTKESLPITGNKLGEIRFVNNPGYEDPITYLWNDRKWISIGGAFDVDLSQYVKRSEIMPTINRLDSLSHTHTNKPVLDATTAAYTVEEQVKLRSLKNYDDTEIREDIESLEQKAHIHNNIDILNATTANFTAEEKQKLAGLHDYEPFTGADASHAGTEGLVPAPSAGDQGKFLSGDGTWKNVQPGGIQPATTETLGGVIVGNGLEITEQGVLSTVGGDGNYSPGTGIIFEEPGYNYNSEYFCNTDVTAVFSPGAGVWPDRTYHRLSSGNAYVMVAEVLNSLTENWFCPIIISKTAGHVGISLQDSNVGYMEFTTPTGSVTYNDETWYYMYAGAMRSPHEYPLYDTTGHVESFELTPVAHDIEDVVLAALAQIYPEHSTGTTLITNTGVLDVSVENGTMTVTKKDGSSQYNVGYELPTASSDTLGGVKVGDGLSIDSNGVLSATGGGGGGGNYTAGDAISLQAASSSITITNLRMLITSRRSSSDSYMQLAELQFLDDSNNVITFSSVGAYYRDMSPVSYPSASENVDKLFDGNTSTKMCCSWDSSGVLIDMALTTPMPVGELASYRYCTANDSSSRDPMEWVILASSDNGSSWFQIDEQLNPTIPTTRVVYTDPFPITYGSISINVKYGDGLSLDQNGALTVTGGGGGTEYVAGEGISIDEGDTTNDITALAWEQGSISSVNGEDDDLTTTAIRSPFIETGLTQMVNVSAQDENSTDMMWKAAFYDSSHAFISMTSTWQTISGDDTRPANAQYVRIILRKANESVIDENCLSYCEISWPIEIGKYVITNTGVTHVEMNGNKLRAVEDGTTKDVLQFSGDFQVTSGTVTIPDYQNLVLHVITQNQ